MLQPYQQRVVDEYNELCNKLNKLQEFINKPQPMFIDDLNWDLLKQQYGIMSAYATLLSKRIDLFKEQ